MLRIVEFKKKLFSIFKFSKNKYNVRDCHQVNSLVLSPLHIEFWINEVYFFNSWMKVG